MYIWCLQTGLSRERTGTQSYDEGSWYWWCLLHGHDYSKTTTPLSTYKGSNEDECDTFQPPLTTFSVDDVCHDVFKIYASFEDVTEHVYTVQTKLPFPLHNMTTPAFINVQCVSGSRLSAAECKQYYYHVVCGDRIIWNRPSSSLTTAFPITRSFHNYCEILRRIAVVDSLWLRIVISMPQCTTNNTGCFCCPLQFLGHHSSYWGTFWDAPSCLLRLYHFTIRTIVMGTESTVTRAIHKYTKGTQSLSHLDTSYSSTSTQTGRRFINQGRKVLRSRKSRFLIFDYLRRSGTQSELPCQALQSHLRYLRKDDAS